MSEDATPFFERVLRVTHAHIAHRALPPTRFEPWTDNRAGSPSYRQYIGYRCINTETDEVAYMYLVPDFEGAFPRVYVHYGGTGDPDIDLRVATVEVSWDGNWQIEDN